MQEASLHQRQKEPRAMNFIKRLFYCEEPSAGPRAVGRVLGSHKPAMPFYERGFSCIDASGILRDHTTIGMYTGYIPESQTGYGTTVFHDVICPKCSYKNPDVRQGFSTCTACGYDLMKGDKP